MGYEKEQMLEKEENWHALAERKGWRCSACMQVLSREEFESNGTLCPSCDSIMNGKD